MSGEHERYIIVTPESRRPQGSYSVSAPAQTAPAQDPTGGQRDAPVRWVGMPAWSERRRPICGFSESCNVLVGMDHRPRGKSHPPGLNTSTFLRREVVSFARLTAKVTPGNCSTGGLASSIVGAKPVCCHLQQPKARSCAGAALLAFCLAYWVLEVWFPPVAVLCIAIFPQFTF